MTRWIGICLFIGLVASGFTLEQRPEFGVLSYNIRYDNPSDGEDAWAHRKTDVLEVLKTSDCPVIGLQEALGHQLAYLDEYLPNYAAFGVGRDDGERVGEFNPVLVDTTAFAVLESGTFWLSETPHTPSRSWKAACHRICTWVHLRERQTSDTLVVLNTHFDHASGEARQRSTSFFCRASLTREVPRDLYPRAQREVLMGDFNAQVYGPTHYALAECWNFGDLNCSLEGPEGTFNAFDPDTPADKRIDFIYLRGLESARYQHLDPRTSSNRCVSDHLPVRAVVRSTR